MDKEWIHDKQIQDKDVIEIRLQNIVEKLAKCKLDFIKESEECKKIREINAKLDVELKEARELEKSHRYNLCSSREMIGNLQETVSQLVHFKRDIKKLKDDMLSRDNKISTMEKDKENLVQNNNNSIEELRSAHQRHIEELTATNERKFQHVQQECDTKVAQLTCSIEELRAQMAEMESENRDKMNMVVLEYEEKNQRGAAQVAQLQEQLAQESAHAVANIDAYRRRLEELEEKLKQSQFKQYLAKNSITPQYESQVQRPYSASKNPYQDTCSLDLEPVPGSSNTKLTNKTPKQNTLQVIYYGNKPPVTNTEKKGQFNISKKRKLYSEKNFQDF